MFPNRLTRFRAKNVVAIKNNPRRERDKYDWKPKRFLNKKIRDRGISQI